VDLNQRQRGNHDWSLRIPNDVTKQDDKGSDDMETGDHNTTADALATATNVVMLTSDEPDAAVPGEIHTYLTYPCHSYIYKRSLV